MRDEIKVFATTRRRIVPISIGGALAPDFADAELLGLLPPEVLRIPEAAGALATGPSQETLDSIQRTFDIVRQDTKRIRAFVLIATVLAALTIAAGVSAYTALLRAREAEQQSLAARKARSEAEVQEAIAQQAKSEALEQKDVAEEQTRVARKERAIATEQRGFAEKRLSQARAALAENLIDLGKLALGGGRYSDDPAAALAHAYASFGLASSDRAATLARDALQSLPVWRTIGRLEKATTLMDPKAGESDPIAATDDLKLIVLAEDRDQRQLKLVDVDSGAVVSRRTLGPDETVLSNEGVATNWLLIRSAGASRKTFQVEAFDMRARSLDAPAWSAPASSVNCATAAPVCLILAQDGQLNYWSKGTSRPVRGPTVNGLVRMSVHPSGTTSALITDGGRRLLVIDHSQSDALVLQADAAALFEWNGNAGDDKDGGRLTGVHFVRNHSRIIVTTAYDIGLIDMARNIRQLIPRKEASPRIGQIAVAGWSDSIAVYWDRQSRIDNEKLEAIKISWPATSGLPITFQREVLATRSDSGRLVAMSFAPNGRYVVIARAEGGGNRTVGCWIESFRTPFDRRSEWGGVDVISVQGRVISRLAHSGSSDRLLAWHGTGASVFRVRSELPDPASDSPVVQVSPILRPELAERFAGRARMDANGENAFVRYGEGDLRRYEVATGRERRLSVSADLGKLLAITRVRGDTFLLCGSLGLMVVTGDKSTSWIPVRGGVAACSAEGNLVLVHSHDGWLLIDLESRRSSTLMADAGREIIWALLGRSSANTIQVTGVAKDGSFFRRSWEVGGSRWNELVDQRTLIRVEEVQVDPSLDSDDRKWGFWVTRRHAFRLDKVESARGLLRVYDWETRNVSVRLRPPAVGWPIDIDQMTGVFSTPEGGTGVVFTGQTGCDASSKFRRCVYVAFWPADGGEAKLVVGKTGGNAVSVSSVAGPDVAHILLYEERKFVWVRASDGAVVAELQLEPERGQLGMPIPPIPHLGRKADGKWDVPSRQALQAIYNRMLMGGLDSGDLVTRVQIPQAVSSRIQGIK